LAKLKWTRDGVCSWSSLREWNMAATSIPNRSSVWYENCVCMVFRRFELAVQTEQRQIANTAVDGEFWNRDHALLNESWEGWIDFTLQ
jgi:hypothetical protein